MHKAPTNPRGGYSKQPCDALWTSAFPTSEKKAMLMVSRGGGPIASWIPSVAEVDNSSSTWELMGRFKCDSDGQVGRWVSSITCWESAVNAELNWGGCHEWIIWRVWQASTAHEMPPPNPPDVCIICLIDFRDFLREGNSLKPAASNMSWLATEDHSTWNSDAVLLAEAALSPRCLSTDEWEARKLWSV